MDERYAVPDAERGGPYPGPEESDSGQVLRQIYGIQETIQGLERTIDVFEHILTPVTRERDESSKDTMAIAEDRLVPLAEDLRSIERRLGHLRMRFNDLADRVTI